MESVVVNPTDAKNKKKLHLLLKDIAKEWSEVEGRTTEWEFLTKACRNNDLLPKNIDLGQLTIRNIELIRSFSFVGEIDLPPDPTTHRVSLHVDEPLIIKSDGAL